MGKKVLVLTASPRKGGNSDLLCDRFILGAKDASNQMEKIYLRDRRIAYCSGCESCFTTHKCVQKDDMEEILEKMIASNVIVMATPVYFFSMSGQMKTLIDRTAPRYEEITEKEFYFIFTAADSYKENMERTLESFRGFLKCLDGAKERGVVYGVGAFHKGDINGSSAMQQAYELGYRI